MNKFKIHSDFAPMGDQPEAIAQLSQGIADGVPAQTLLGVTGSGKTFTIANVIANAGKPTLVLSHNKTLAAQLYSEFKGFFPENAVEYYVSYYDYYQPEAYIASTDTYIEKDLAINEDIDKLRLAATSALLSGRKDVVVVSSVSCIYGMGNPSAFYENVIELKVGAQVSPNVLLRKLVSSLYTRNDVAPKAGNFRVKGDTVDIYLAYADELLRVSFWGDEIDGIEEIDALNGYKLAEFEEYKVYPANLFLTSKETQEMAIRKIQDDLREQVALFEEEGKTLEAKRLQERVSYDIEMIRELGHCSGIENYSRYFDGREAGTRPYCLLGEHHSEFLSAVVAVVEEDHHVAFLNTSIAVGVDERLHKFVGVLVVFRIGVVAALNAFHHVGHLASLALNELVVSHLNAVPTLVTVHSIETADDAGNMCACRFAMLDEVGDESLAALRVGVTTVHEAVNISLVGDAVFACDVNEFEEVVERRVHTTR